MEERAKLRGPLTRPEDRVNFLALMQQCWNMGLHDRVLELWEAASGEFWELGHWNDYLQCGTVAFGSAEARNNIAVQAGILNELGWAHMERKRFSEAHGSFKASLQKYRLVKNIGGQCRLLRDLGTLLLRQARLGSALKHYRKALEIVQRERAQARLSEQIIWIHREAELHNLLGSLYLKLHEFPASGHELHLALNQYRSLGNSHRYYQAAPLLNLGRWYFLQGDYDTARKYYAECRQLSQALGRIDMVAGALLRLAEVAEAEGNREEALQLAREAERVSGTDIISMRERASRLKYRVAGRNKRAVNTFLNRYLKLCLVVIDLLITSPALALRALKNYSRSGIRGVVD